MAKYRKKPVVIEAVQFDINNPEPAVEFAQGLFRPLSIEDRVDDPEIVAEVWDRLHATWVGVFNHQWIIKGVQGEFYPCEDSVFRDTYEPVVES